MDGFRKRFLRLLAAIALFAFAGDLSADAISDAMGDHCNVPSSDASSAPEKAPCSHCVCAAHNGAMVMAEAIMQIGRSSGPAASLAVPSSGRPIRRAAAIDHPPQLG